MSVLRCWHYCWLPMPEHLTDYWTRRAVDFIDQQSADQPFFLLLNYNGPYMLPPTVTMEPNNRYAAYYQQHTPSFPQEPVHPYLKTWATGRGPSGLMVREGTTAWTAINALNNKTAMVNTASETAMVDEYADPKYDLWRGGTAKARLLEEHYGRDDIFSDRFPDWRQSFVEKASPYEP